MKQFLASTVLVAAPLATFPQSAAALCNETAPGTVFCDGSVTPLTGFSRGTDGFDITVDVINDFFGGLRIPGNNHSVSVFGQIISSGGEAIRAGDDLELIVDADRITGTNAVVAGDRLDLDFSLGLIRGNGTGVIAGDDAKLLLSGDASFGASTIDGFFGARLGNNATVNLSTGFSEIKAFGDALTIEGVGDVDLVEGSLIESDGPDGNGVTLSGGSVFNEGFIRAANVGILVAPGTTEPTSIDIGFTGFVRGQDAAIRVADGDASTSDVTVQIFGVADGDIALGGGADRLRYSDFNAVGGASFLGAGDDIFEVSDTVEGFTFLGASSDGGAGYDIADLSSFDLAGNAFDVSDITGGVFVDITTGIDTLFPDTVQLSLFNFEEFRFGAETYSRQALSLAFNLAPVPAPIPVPASLLFLLAGLGSLGLIRRGRG